MADATLIAGLAGALEGLGAGLAGQQFQGRILDLIERRAEKAELDAAFSDAADAIMQQNPEMKLGKAALIGALKTQTGQFVVESAEGRAGRRSTEQKEEDYARWQNQGAQGLPLSGSEAANPVAQGVWREASERHADRVRQESAAAWNYVEEARKVMAGAVRMGDQARFSAASADANQRAQTIFTDQAVRDQVLVSLADAHEDGTQEIVLGQARRQIQAGERPGNGLMSALTGDRAIALREDLNAYESVVLQNLTGLMAAEGEDGGLGLIGDVATREQAQRLIQKRNAGTEFTGEERAFLHDLPMAQLSNEVQQRRAMRLEQDKAGALVGGIMAQASEGLRGLLGPLFSGARTVPEVERIRGERMIPLLESGVGNGTIQPLDAILVAPESPTLRTAAVGSITGDNKDGVEIPTVLAQNWSTSKHTRIEQADLASLISVPLMQKIGPFRFESLLRPIEGAWPTKITTSRPDYAQALPVAEGLAVGLIQSIVPSQVAPEDALKMERSRQQQIVAMLPQSPEAAVAAGRIAEINQEIDVMRTTQTTSRGEVAGYLNKALTVAGFTTQQEWIDFFEKDKGMGALENWQGTLLPDDLTLKDPNLDYFDRASLALVALINAADAGGLSASAMIRQQLRDALLAIQQPLIEQVRASAGGVSDEQAEAFWRYASNKPADLRLLGGAKEPMSVRLAATLWARSFLTSQAALGAR